VRHRPAPALLALALAVLPGCDDYNYSPGAGRTDLSYYLLVSDPTGDTLAVPAGVRWDPLRSPGGGPGPLLQLRSMGVRAVLPTGDAWDLSAFLPDSGADAGDPESWHFEEADSALRLVLEAGLVPLPSLRLDDRACIAGTDPAGVLVRVVGHCSDSSSWGAGAVPRIELKPTPDDSGGCGLPADMEELLALPVEIVRRTPGRFGRILSADAADVRSGIQDAERMGVTAHSCVIVTDDPLDYVAAGENLAGVAGAGRGLPILTGWGPEGHGTDDAPPSPALLTASWICILDAGFEEAWLDADGDWYRNHDGSPSPLLWLFALWRECGEHPSRLGTFVTMDGDQWAAVEGSDRLWALAGEDETGEVAILLANLTGDTACVDVTLLRNGLRGGLAGRVLRAGPAEGGIVSDPAEERSITMMPGEALLVVGTPR